MIGKELVQKLDDFLVSQNTSLELTIAGGAGLVLLDITNRFTHDMDVLEPNLSTSVKLLSIDFAEKHPELKLEAVTWLNDAASVFKKDLQTGWRDRTQVLHDGPGLKLKTLGRQDFLVAKVKSFTNREAQDYADIVALAPNEKELADTTKWVISITREAEKTEVVESLERLKKQLEKIREADKEPEPEF